MSEKKSTSTALAWTFGTKLTLQGLINQYNESSQGGGDDKNRLAVLNLPVCSDEAPPYHDGFEALHDEDFESLEFDPSLGKGALSFSSSEGSPECNPEVESPKATTSVASFGEDDDADFEPISSNPREKGRNLVASLTEVQSEPVPEIASSAVVTLEPSTTLVEEQRDEGDGDNLWLKLGGSFAVVGAVVGGVALAAAQNHGGEDQKRRDGKRENK